MALVLVAIAPGKTVHWQEQALTFDPAVFSMALNNWHGVSEPVGSFTERSPCLSGWSMVASG